MYYYKINMIERGYLSPVIVEKKISELEGTHDLKNAKKSE